MTRLLIIDDEKMLLETLEYFFWECGFEVITEHSSVKALQKYQQDPTIDVVLTDIRMPHLSGSELIKKMMAIRFLPIIAITGYSDVAHHLLRDYGAVKVINKPLEYNSMVDTVTQAATKRFPIGKPEEGMEDKFKEFQHDPSDHLVFGRHGFYVESSDSFYQPSDFVKFAVSAPWGDELLRGVGQVIFRQDIDQRSIQQGMAIEISHLDGGQTQFDEYLTENGIVSSIPIAYAKKGY